MSTVVVSGARRRREPRRRTALWLLLPLLGFLAVFFLYPLGAMLSRSVYADGAFTTRFFQRVIDDPAYLQVLWTTFEIAAMVTVATLVLGYPLAYFLSRRRPRTAALLMILVVVPYFTSVLVRTYAWMVLLGSHGLINEGLLALGVIDRPLTLLYNRVGVLIGMTYMLLPYMVLALYSVMRSIDTSLLRAAESLGASRLRAFWRVFFPLSRPGLASGSLLVFILALGYFITPALMGSQQDSLISMVIEAQVETYFDWNFASALAALLLGSTLVLFALYERLVGLNRLFESKL
ncbi:ABC transporter permease [Chitinasiproducens palmae]|uniref:Putative spermidine/putrescine transport system permease protein n=1 Tax=Chitinasiproducens palmae TaxID=1770053 RepID=A0A1H2PK12_9BURK|nr:ABC transporter permease [Chitinasiproducens palmae]SDV46736.1 putative spermidine/putrescine transport system permease protein [Chitinasiproducens palmae]